MGKVRNAKGDNVKKLSRQTVEQALRDFQTIQTVRATDEDDPTAKGMYETRAENARLILKNIEGKEWAITGDGWQL